MGAFFVCNKRYENKIIVNGWRSQTKPWRRLEEREGFEPSVPFGYNGFQDRRIRPLCHLSVISYISSKAYLYSTKKKVENNRSKGI
jgi:hypothetical protein